METGPGPAGLAINPQLALLVDREVGSRLLTKLIIRRFKQFEDVEIDLGNPVVFVGPNDAGKTSALQALTLWQIGVRRFHEKHGGKGEVPERRPGVAINRRDLTGIPAPVARLLWHELKVRTKGDQGGTKNVLIEVIVEGTSGNEAWACGVEFDYANEESFYCRPLRLEDDERMPIPAAALDVEIAFLAPMSGLAPNETRLDPGAINVRIGEGRTADVLRNLCYQVQQMDPERWEGIKDQLQELFGVGLNDPTYVSERGEINMSFVSRRGVELDLSSSGRGLQQTLLLLTFLRLHRGAVVLLDEPDAHLEILRQRQVYRLLSETTRRTGGQIVAASHSEIILNEAADQDVVVAFLGRPHRIDDRGSQLLKSLKEVGFEQYYQAETAGWVLYLEGSTDLAVLQSFAEALGHPAASALERPFVTYVGNVPSHARSHFYALREAKEDLQGLAVFDHLAEAELRSGALREFMWDRNEIENYLCQPETLEAFAAWLGRESSLGPLFEESEIELRVGAIRRAIEDQVPPAALRDRDHDFWSEVKASDKFLGPVFDAYYSDVGVPALAGKSDFHRLAAFVPAELISQEVVTVLDLIHETAQAANPGPTTS